MRGRRIIDSLTSANLLRGAEPFNSNERCRVAPTRKRAIPLQPLWSRSEKLGIEGREPVPCLHNQPMTVTCQQPYYPPRIRRRPSGRIGNCTAERRGGRGGGCSCPPHRSFAFSEPQITPPPEGVPESHTGFGSMMARPLCA